MLRQRKDSLASKTYNRRDNEEIEADEKCGLNPYAVSKVVNETFARYVSTANSLPISIFRFPGVLTEEPSDRALEFVERHEGLMEGMGTYIYAPDLARAYVAAVESDATGCEVYNLCAADVRLNAPVRESLIRFRPEYPALPVDWPAYKSPLSCEKAAACLNWRPTWSFVEYYAGRRGRPLPGAWN